MIRFLTVLFLLVLISEAKAEVYLGLGGGISIVDIETNCNGCTTYDTNKLSVQSTGFVGYRYHNTAIEAGAGEGRFRAHAVLPSRPADMRQEIDSRFVYLSALQYFPVSHGEVFMGAGLSRVLARNYEYGLNRDDSTSDPAHYMENHTSTNEIAPFIQAGYQYEHLRMGVSFIPNVVRSHWTKSEDIYNVNVSYVWRF